MTAKTETKSDTLPVFSEEPSTADDGGTGGIRYRSMALNATLSAIILIGFWTWPELTGSTRVIATGSVFATSFVWFMIWLSFFSRIPTAPRRLMVSTILLTVVLVCASFRVRGYTGDLVPILACRWSSAGLTPKELGGVGNPLRHVPIVDEPTQFDSPGFLGQHRRPVVDQVRLFRDWSARPPQLLWHKAIGDDAGFSSFAVVGDVGVTQQQAGELELVVCYDLPSGDILWTHSDPVRFDSTIGGVGPRATPTIDKGRVYTMGATGILNCLDFQTGDTIWSHHVLEENNASTLRWGIAVSPLVIDSLVIVSTGHPEGPAFATLVAYDQHSGDVVWKAGHDASSYSSPAVVTLLGQRQILIVNNSSISSHDPATGTILWEEPWSSLSSNTSQPVPLSAGRLLITKGYGNGAHLWQLAKSGDDWSVSKLWHSPRLLRTKATSTVVRDGHAYGLSDGFLECVDIDASSRCWKQRGYGHGQVILVDDLLLVQVESGDVALVEATPDRFLEVARFSPLASRTWNYPVLAGSYLIVRNDREIACYILPLDSTSPH